MTEAIAIDVVLLPDAATNDWLISLSEKLAPTSPYVLNTVDRFAHMTLSHGHVKRSSLQALKKGLQKIASGGKPLSLEVTHLTSAYREHLDLWNYWPSVKLSPELRFIAQGCHEILRPKLVELPESDVEYIMDSEEPPVTDGLFRFSQQYLSNFSFDQSDFHFTVGYGPEGVLERELTRTVSVDRLALCQLGSEGTCRKILAEWPLAEQAL